MQINTPLRKHAPLFHFAKRVKRSVPLILLLAIFTVLFLSWRSGRPVAAEENKQLIGRFVVAWADPLPGSGGAPRTDYYLIDENGENIKLNVTPKAIENAGGIAALSHKRVKVEGVTIENKGLSPGFEVSSISLENSASLTPESSAPRLGNLKYINILCTLTDGGSLPHAPSYYTDLLGEDYPELGHYWRDVSYDQMNITGSTTAGWYNLPYSRSHYLNSQNKFDTVSFAQDCAGLADTDVYFPDYYGINFATNAFFEANYSGQGSSELSLSFDGGPRIYGATWINDSGYINQSILAHEMGHSLGLEHSNGGHGAQYDSNWDVMSNTGTIISYPPYGTIAPHPISGSKNLLGWIPSNRLFTAPISGSNTINLAKLNILPFGNKYLMAKIPIHGSYGSYYTVEVRDKFGYDEAVPAKAVVIHKFPSAGAVVVDSDGNPDPNDAGAQWTAGETFYSAADRVSIAVNYELTGVFNVTVEANSGCTYSLGSTSQSFTSAGGEGSFNIVTQSGCYWALSGADPQFYFSGAGFDVNDAPTSSPYIGVASTYPSTETVSGVSGTVTKVIVTLNRINHPSPGDLDFILVAPNQEKVILMSDAGGNYGLTDIKFTFDSFASNYLAQFGANAAGTYRPTDYGFSDIFPSPGPGTSIFYSDLDRFNGIDPNGDWKLFAVDDANGNSGSLSRGWEMTIFTGAVTTSTFFGVGSQTVNYTVTRNYGAARTIYVTAAGQTFTITQGGV